MAAGLFPTTTCGGGSMMFTWVGSILSNIEAPADSFLPDGFSAEDAGDEDDDDGFWMRKVVRVDDMASPSDETGCGVLGLGGEGFKRQ